MKKHTPQTRQIIYCDTGVYRTTWCGPYAIAVICGTEYEQAYRTVRAIRGKMHCKGITCDNLTKASAKLGVKGKWVDLEKRQKFGNFMKTLEKNKVYVINVTKHFLILDTRDYTTIDNQVPKWIAGEMSKHKSKLVSKYFVVENPKFEPKENNEWLIEPLAASK